MFNGRNWFCCFCCIFLSPSPLSLSLNRSSVFAIFNPLAFLFSVHFCGCKLFILTLSHLIWMMAIANYSICRSRPLGTVRSHKLHRRFSFFLRFCTALYKLYSIFLWFDSTYSKTVCNSLHAIPRTINNNDFKRISISFCLCPNKLLEWLVSITQYYLPV